MASSRGLIITDKQLDRCDELLSELKGLLNCRFLALISTAGQPITTVSDETVSETLSLASLAASSFAATRELAHTLNENEFTLLFHEGSTLNLHVAQVTDRVLLLITFGHDVPVGRVRLYTQRAIVVLKRVFEETGDAEKLSAVDEEYGISADRRIDEVFRDNAAG